MRRKHKDEEKLQKIINIKLSLYIIFYIYAYSIMVYTPKFKKGDRIKNIRDHRIDQVTDVVYKKDARYPFHEGYGYILYPRGGGWWLCEDIDIEFEIVPGKTENDKLETEET